MMDDDIDAEFIGKPLQFALPQLHARAVAQVYGQAQNSG
jgi:hypothetical protein